MPQIDPKVKRSQDLLEEYSSARADWAKQAIEDNEFRSGKQWTDDQVKTLKARNQSPVVVNVIHSAVEQAKALLTTNKPRFQSTGREDSDRKTGRIFSDIMSYIWDTSNGNMALKQAIDDYYVKGMGCIMAYPDPNKDFGTGEVCIKSIDPLDVYIDPSSRDPFCEDAHHVIIAKKIMEHELIGQFPEMAEPIKQAKQTSLLNGYDTSRHALNNELVTPYERGTTESIADGDRELEVIERYSKAKMPMKKVYDPFTPKEYVFGSEEYFRYASGDAFMIQKRNVEEPIFVTSKRDVAETQDMYDRYGNEFHEYMDKNTGQISIIKGPERAGSVPGSTTFLTKLKISDLIADQMIQVQDVMCDKINCTISVGDTLLYQYMKPISHYPIVTLMNHHYRNPYPVSDVRLVKGLQEYVNKIRSLIIAHASSSTNVKLLIPRGSMDKKRLEQDWGKAGTAVIEFDPELGQPVVAGPVPLPNELYANEKEAKADIEKILGIYALMQGDQGAAPGTYKGTIALDEFGQRRIRSKKDDVEGMLNQLAKVTVEMIQWIYTDRKVIRLIQPNRESKEVVLNQDLYDDLTNSIIGRTNDVTIGRYDLIVISGSTLPSNRWARYEYYKELYQMQVIDQVELLKQTDVADAEGVLERSGQQKQAMQQISALQDEVKRLKGDLQTAQRESLHDRKRVELKDFEVRLAKLESSASMASQLYKHRANDHLKKLKDEVSVLQDDANTTQTDLNEQILGMDE